MKPVDKENIFKKYSAAERNEGKDNVVVEEAKHAAKNIHEQIACMILEKVFPNEEIKVVSDQEGPPDIEIGGGIGIEVKGIELDDGEWMSWDRLGKAIAKKAHSVRKAVRKEREGRGRRLAKVREIWFVVVMSLPIMWIRTEGMDDKAWNRRLSRERNGLDETLRKHLKGSLANPEITRVIVTTKSVFPANPPTYVYNTKQWKHSITAEKLPQNADSSEMVEGLTEFGGIRLTRRVAHQSRRGTTIENEAKTVLK